MGRLYPHSFALAVTLLAVCAALLTPPPARCAEGVSGEVLVDVHGAVFASQCTPCHADFDVSDSDGPRFSHGSHLTVACAACHWGVPHVGGSTAGPVMRSCFNCHGLSHGDLGSIAGAECETCHRPGEELQPANHDEDWVNEGHSPIADRGAGDCMMCHSDTAECDECHVASGVLTDPVAAVFMGVLPVLPDRQPRYVVIDGETTAEQCNACHPSTDARPSEVLTFAHSEHPEDDGGCAVCHQRFAHQVERVLAPPMRACDDCHGQAAYAMGAPSIYECGACHPADFALKPTEHSAEFDRGQHRLQAMDDRGECAMCHVQDACVDCHYGRRQQPDGRRMPRVVPTNHKGLDWLGGHGVRARSGGDTCSDCHDTQSCEACHHTPMPHPADWLSNHEAESSRDERDCNVCHVERDRCQRCHHEPVLGGSLDVVACNPCHADMTPDSAAIPSRVFAEHAVHFGKTVEAGLSLSCDDCHTTYGGTESGRRARADLVQAGHDLGLCYSCHRGRSDSPQSVGLPSGDGLCLSCHDGLEL